MTTSTMIHQTNWVSMRLWDSCSVLGTLEPANSRCNQTSQELVIEGESSMAFVIVGSPQANKCQTPKMDLIWAAEKTDINGTCFGSTIYNVFTIIFASLISLHLGKHIQLIGAGELFLSHWAQIEVKHLDISTAHPWAAEAMAFLMSWGHSWLAASSFVHDVSYKWNAAMHYERPCERSTPLYQQTWFMNPQMT